jgi:hypothetical protein
METSVATEQGPNAYQWRNGIVIGAAALTLVGSIFFAGREIKGDIEGCAPPSAAAVDAVEQLINIPLPKFPGRTAPERGAQVGKYERAKQAELGITFPVYDVRKLHHLGTGVGGNIVGTPPPFTEYKTMLTGILGQLDIPLRIGVPENVVGLDKVDARQPAAEELETSAAKFQVLRLSEMFARAPIQLSTNLGITEVALTAKGKSDIGGYSGLALTHDGVLIVDVVSAEESNYDLAFHEYYHLVDSDACGPQRIHTDRAYAAQNVAGTYAERWPLPPGFIEKQPKSYGALADSRGRLYTKKNEAREREDRGAYCNAEAELDTLHKDVEVNSDYSYYNVAEDKAEIGSQVLQPQEYPHMLDPTMPVRRNKFKLLLARLYEKHRNVATYYLSIANKALSYFYNCK